jgi:hypothetical protein
LLQQNILPQRIAVLMDLSTIHGFQQTMPHRLYLTRNFVEFRE